MKYSDTENLNGIIQEEERLTGLGYAGISDSTNNLKEFTSLNNIESSKIWHIIHSATGNWSYDDSNEDDLPIATTNVSDSQATYQIPSDALTIQRIEIKDNSGNWYKLKPIELKQVQSEGEFFETDGQPIYYRLIGETIKLYPATNYDSTDGLKVFYDREAVAFLTTDTTATPGFASPYHSIIAKGGALAWLKTKAPTSPKIPLLINDYNLLENKIKQYYSTRFTDKKPRVSRAYSNFK